MLIVVGAGWHGRAVARAYGARVSFLDDFVVGHLREGDVLGPLGAIEKMEPEHNIIFIVGVGDCKTRMEITRRLRRHRHPMDRIVDQTATAKYSQIGDGTVVMPGAIVSPDASIGLSCIINNQAIISHDAVLEDGVNVSDQAILSGRVGQEAFIGLGARILPGINIGARAIVGAGAVVTKDVPPDVTVAGVPARIIKQRGTHGDHRDSAADAAAVGEYSGSVQCRP